MRLHPVLLSDVETPDKAPQPDQGEEERGDDQGKPEIEESSGRGICSKTNWLTPAGKTTFSDRFMTLETIKQSGIEISRRHVHTRKGVDVTNILTIFLP
jgi:hypothetical protein